MNLTEATILALQGKLNLQEDVEIETDQVEVTVGDDKTVIDTEDSTVTVEKNNETSTEEEPVEVETSEEIVSDADLADDNLDVEPVETSNEDTEEVISDENIETNTEDSVIEDTDTETEEDESEDSEEELDESKKLNESNAEDFIKDVEDAKLLGWDGKDETFKDYMKKVNDMRQVNKELKKENNEENTNKLKDINFKQWYMENVPEDNFLFDDLRDDTTFQDILDTLKAGNNVYDAMFKEGKGGDSTVRENVFSALSDMLNVDYDDVYYLWLYPERDNKLKENKEIKKEADEENEEDEEIDNNILDLLQNRIGQNLTVGELNTILQGVLGKYNEVYLLTSDLYNMNPEEPQELVVFDDDDMYTITYNIEDMDNAIIQITDVELD